MSSLLPSPSASNPLTDLVPVKHRRKVYAYFALIGLVAGAVQIAFLAIDPDLPVWLTICVLVYNFLALPVGALATSNAGTYPQESL